MLSRNGSVLYRDGSVLCKAGSVLSIHASDTAFVGIRMGEGGTFSNSVTIRLLQNLLTIPS
jgi:hypothetical protein